MNGNHRRTGMLALTAIVVNAMLSGIAFDLPRVTAFFAGPKMALAIWLLTGLTIFMVANTFRIIAEARPESSVGIYFNSRSGFGRFAGFEMAWLYWLRNIAVNGFYAMMLLDILDRALPGGSAGWIALVAVSLLLWIIHGFIALGFKPAAMVNLAGAALMLTVLAGFIFFAARAFDVQIFIANWDAAAPPETKLTPFLAVAIWTFAGIEGAAILADHGDDRRSVGRATLAGFWIALLVAPALSLLPWGLAGRPELAQLGDLSTAPLLTAIAGNRGGILMVAGNTLALLTGWLAFAIISIQVPRAAADDGAFPRAFCRLNRRGVPVFSLLATGGLTQAVLIALYFAGEKLAGLLPLAVLMVLAPYLVSCGYLWKICLAGEYPIRMTSNRKFAHFCGAAGTLLVLALIVTAGIKYLLLAVTAAAIGLPVFIRARNDAAAAPETAPDDRRHFTGIEAVAAGLLVVAAMLVTAAVAAGWIDF
ncbi:MAG: amino acid permease [Victivallaceae bacterium]